MKMVPYLNFDGQCEEAFRFYEQCLGGEIVMMMTHGDSPIAGEVPSESHPRIMHARLVVGDATLMGSDSPSEHFQKPQGIYVAIQIEDPEKGERIFNELSEGGQVTMPFEKTFWARGFGMLVDRFGISWMINCE